MIVRVLGSAAGGGVPQWNCACVNCTAARAGLCPRRSQSGLAVSTDGKRWLLLNCSPDIGTQIEAFAPMQPRTSRGTPIAGILLTDANVDHLGGLTTLRQSGEHRFIVRSSDAVRAIATTQPAFMPFAQPPHLWLEVPLRRLCEPADAGDVVGNELSVRAIPVPGTTPGYDGRRQVEGAVVAYEIADARGGGTILFAPVFSSIDRGLAGAIAAAKIAFLDGTFHSDDELIAQQLLPKRATSLGHQPVGGEHGTLARLARTSARIVFTHLNNSNPMLDPHSPAARSVMETGAEIAYDGMELHV